VKRNIISPPLCEALRTGYRYGLYFHKLTAPNGVMYARPIIMLRNGFNDIVRFTSLHIYAEPFNSKLSVPLTSSNNEKLYLCCLMLNYIIIDHHEQFKIDHIFP